MTVTEGALLISFFVVLIIAWVVLLIILDPRPPGIKTYKEFLKQQERNERNERKRKRDE